MKRLYEWVERTARGLALSQFSELAEEPAGPAVRLALRVAHRLYPIIPYSTKDTTPYGRALLLLGRRDIQEVLDRDDVFSVNGYDARMKATSGQFFLGMDLGSAGYVPEQREAAHALGKQPGRERDQTAGAFLPGDVARIKSAVDAEARRAVTDAVTDAVAEAPRRGLLRLDASKQVANRVPMALLRDYFGIAEMRDRAGNPVPGMLITKGREVSYYVFNFFASGPEDSEPATKAGRDIHAHLLALARAARAEPIPGDTVIHRLLTPFPCDHDVARTIGGVALGGLVPGLGTTLHSIARLVQLAGPERDRLERAAKQNDLQTVFNFAREGARFGPYPPTLFRTCLEDYTLGVGTVHERRIPRGTTVVPLFIGAAFDPDFVQSPDTFNPDRPKAEYLLFGRGQHECLGTYLGEYMLARTVCELFKLKRLRRAGVKKPPPTNAQFAPFGDELLLDFDVA